MKGDITESIYIHEICKWYLKAKGSSIPWAESCSHNVTVIKEESTDGTEIPSMFPSKRIKIDSKSKRLEIDYG